jgi:RNA polymerase sigma factor (sigma-70 family)
MRTGVTLLNYSIIQQPFMGVFSQKRGRGNMAKMSIFRTVSNQNMTEEAIIFGCLQNDAAAQRELYNRYSPKMLSVCYRFGQSREDAEDMLQEGFIKVFTQIHTFQNKGAFEGWIRRIIVHTCINFLKKYKKFNDSVDLAYASYVAVKEETVPSIMQAKQVIESIRLLPVGYKTVLNLYAIEGYSHKEIAQMLDIEESTSRSQYTRAKSMLETILIKKKIIERPKENFDWLALLKK